MHGYVTSTGLNKRVELNTSGTVFVKVLDYEGRTLQELCDKLLEIFVGVERSAILNDAENFYDNLVHDGFLVSGESIKELDSKDKSLRNAQPHIEKDSINFLSVSKEIII